MRQPYLRKRKALLNALLAEACASGCTLASLEFWVALADDVERTLALHDLAISVTTLHGCEGGKNFHVIGICLRFKKPCFGEAREGNNTLILRFVKTNLCFLSIFMDDRAQNKLNRFA